jgi:hypothetical protein
VGFFLFPIVKSELAGLSLTQESFQKSWEGAVRTISQDDFATAFDGGWGKAKSASGLAATMSNYSLK